MIVKMEGKTLVYCPTRLTTYSGEERSAFRPGASPVSRMGHFATAHPGIRSFTACQNAGSTARTDPSYRTWSEWSVRKSATVGEMSPSPLNQRGGILQMSRSPSAEMVDCKVWSSYDPERPPERISAHHVRFVVISDTHSTEPKDIPDGVSYVISAESMVTSLTDMLITFLFRFRMCYFMLATSQH